MILSRMMKLGSSVVNQLRVRIIWVRNRIGGIVLNSRSEGRVLTYIKVVSPSFFLNGGFFLLLF